MKGYPRLSVCKAKGAVNRLGYTSYTHLNTTEKEENQKGEDGSKSNSGDKLSLLHDHCFSQIVCDIAQMKFPQVLSP